MITMIYVMTPSLWSTMVLYDDDMFWYVMPCYAVFKIYECMLLSISNGPPCWVFSQTLTPLTLISPDKSEEQTKEEEQDLF